MCNRQRPPAQRLRFRKKITLAQEMLTELQQRLPPGFQVFVLFDSWYAANRLLKFCRRQHWHVVCAIKSNHKLDDTKLSQWPQALRHQRYQRVQLPAKEHSVILTLFTDAVDGVQIPGQRSRYTLH